MQEVPMVRNTVQRLGGQLERLAAHGVPLNRAFDMLARKAQSIEDIVVVEVMREVYGEMHQAPAPEEPPAKAERSGPQADSSTRSARMPSMALSR